MATLTPLPIDERAALIAAIRAHPADDAPRLVFADWLDEHGDSDRATFIRLQIERAREPRGSDRLTILDRQLKPLQKRVAKAVFQGETRVWRAGAFFERGFIDRLNTSSTQFLRAGAALLAREPVHELALHSPNEHDFAAFLEHPALGHAVRLKISHGHLGNEGAFQLAACANLRHVRELDLGANYILTDGIRALAESPHFTSLEHLTLKYNDAFAEGARAIAASTSLQGLKYLDIGCNEIGPEGLKALLKAPFAKQLTGLHIEGNPGYEPLLRVEGMQILEKTRSLPNLEDLDVDSNEIGDAGCLALCRTKALKKLKRLDLQGNSIHPAGLALLFEGNSSLNAQLEELSLQSNSLEGLQSDRGCNQTALPRPAFHVCDGLI